MELGYLCLVIPFIQEEGPHFVSSGKLQIFSRFYHLSCTFTFAKGFGLQFFAFLACLAFLALVSENREILFYLVRAYFFIIFFPYRFFVSFPFNLFVLNYFGKKVLAKNFLDKITFLEKLKRLFQIT